MTKLVKLSLAAAIAVSGLSSTVAAKPLEEAIKGVDVSGSVVYRYDDRQSDFEGIHPTRGVTDDQFNERTTNTYKAAVTATIPVNDTVKAKVNAVVRGVTGDNPDGDNDFDQNPSWNLTQANFIYTGIANTVVIAGKQAVPGPWHDAGDSINTSNTGTGIVAQTNVAGVTLAAAHFVNTNTGTAGALDANANDITAVGAIASMGPVNGQLWYAHGNGSEQDDLQDGFSAWTAVVDGSVGPVSMALRHSQFKPKTVDISGGADGPLGMAASPSVRAALIAANELNVTPGGDFELDVDTQKLTTFTIGADLGMFGLNAGYARGGSNGSLVALEEDADNVFTGWAITAGDVINRHDLKAYSFSANVDVLPNLNWSATYVKAKYESLDITQNVGTAVGLSNFEYETKAKEWFTQLTYQMSDNFQTYVRYGVVKSDDDRDDVAAVQQNSDLKQQRGRIQLAYTF